MSARSKVVEPLELYRRWEQQHWSAHAVDFAQDRRDWLQLTDQERRQWYMLAGFVHFRESETHALRCLAALLPCLPRPEQQHFLSTQIADEARHAYFFERFHGEVLSAAQPAQDIPLAISPAYQRLFIASSADLVDKAVGERSHQALATAVAHIFVMLEGAVATATFSVTRQLLVKTGLFPGLLEGMTNAQRDEVRHAQFGIALLQHLFAAQPQCRDAVAAYIQSALPLFSEVLQPRPTRAAILQSLGLDPHERRHRAFNLLKRHLGAVGIDGALVETWVAAA